MTSLADALPAQIQRVVEKRDRWISMTQDHPELAGGMSFAIALMQHEIMGGVRALASADIAEMLSAHEALAAYGDDD